MTIGQDARELAEELADELGWSALDDRLRIMERMADRGLLSPRSNPDHAADEALADDVESHIRWVLT